MAWGHPFLMWLATSNWRTAVWAEPSLYVLICCSIALLPEQPVERCPWVAGKKLEVAKLRAEGGLSTRRACSKCRLPQEAIADLSWTSNNLATSATSFLLHPASQRHSCKVLRLKKPLRSYDNLITRLAFVKPLMRQTSLASDLRRSVGTGNIAKAFAIQAWSLFDIWIQASR